MPGAVFFSLALVAEAHEGVAEARSALGQLESQQDLPRMASRRRRAPVEAGRRHGAKTKGFSLKISRGPACVGRKLANTGDVGVTASETRGRPYASSRLPRSLCRSLKSPLPSAPGQPAAPCRGEVGAVVIGQVHSAPREGPVGLRWQAGAGVTDGVCLGHRCTSLFRGRAESEPSQGCSRALRRSPPSIRLFLSARLLFCCAESRWDCSAWKRREGLSSRRDGELRAGSVVVVPWPPNKLNLC